MQKYLNVFPNDCFMSAAMIIIAKQADEKKAELGQHLYGIECFFASQAFQSYFGKVEDLMSAASEQEECEKEKIDCVCEYLLAECDKHEGGQLMAASSPSEMAALDINLDSISQQFIMLVLPLLIQFAQKWIAERFPKS